MLSDGRIGEHVVTAIAVGHLVVPKAEHVRDDGRQRLDPVGIHFAKLLHRLIGEWCYLGEGCVQVRRSTVETPEFPVHIDAGAAVFSRDQHGTGGAPPRAPADNKKGLA